MRGTLRLQPSSHEQGTIEDRCNPSNPQEAPSQNHQPDSKAGSEQLLGLFLQSHAPSLKFSAGVFPGIHRCDMPSRISQACRHGR